MDDPLARGLPFELADVWRRSVFQFKEEDQTLFAPLEASFPPLRLEPNLENIEHVLVIPPLEGEENGSRHLEPPESDLTSPPSELWVTGQDAPNDSTSVWDLDLDLNQPPHRPRLRTWEAFEKEHVPRAERTAYLSEAGPVLFDAVLANRAGKSNGVLPQDVMLRALCNLSLGRASMFFRWDEMKGAFIRSLEGVHISGYSSAVCDSFTGGLMEYAALYRSLRSSCTKTYARRYGVPTSIAFNGCVSDILDGIEGSITHGVAQVQSVLQLQALVEPHRELLAVLGRVRESIEDTVSDEGVISSVSDHVHEAVSADSSLAGVMREVLDRTSKPWLERLASDLGLVDGQIGGMKGDHEGSEDDYALDSSLKPATSDGKVSAFMSIEDTTMIHDAKLSLKILRKTLPSPVVNETAHALCGDALASNVSVPVITEDDFEATQDVKTIAETEALAWSEPTVQHGFLSRIDARISGPLSSLNRTSDPLRNALASYCDPGVCEMDSAMSLEVNISPLDRLRPALTLQANYLNRTLLRHMFTAGLRHHLHIQHSYHCLASGEAVTRLSTALFSTETQSAERKRRTIPTGQTMGLRLGAARTEQRWPPASSELRLTLMDVLAETYRADFPPETTSKGELPGNLSFTIRELPEADIERVMDPASIYALDFLRLQYTAPAPLDAVLTGQAMEVYDQVFRVLLRVLRAVYVSTVLVREVARRQFGQGIVNSDLKGAQEDRKASVQFAQRAQAATTALASYCVDLGVAEPWRRFSHSLQHVYEELQTEGTGAAGGLDRLRRLHGVYLSSMRNRLFLRSRQEKIRLAIEELLSAVLKGASVMAIEGEERAAKLGRATVQLEQAVKALLELLHRAVEQPRKRRVTTGTNDDNDSDEDDVEVMKVLLVRLDYNGFYGVEEAARPS